MKWWVKILSHSRSPLLPLPTFEFLPYHSPGTTHFCSVNMFTSALAILNKIILVMWALVQTERAVLRHLQPSSVSDVSPHMQCMYVYE